MEKLSVIVPSRNESDNLIDTITEIYETLKSHNINHEIIIIDDGSNDNTRTLIDSYISNIPTLYYIFNEGKKGFGRAVRLGLDKYSGSAVAIIMADRSDSPKDLIKYWEILNSGVECAFGSRFINGSKITNYPKVKLLMNRIVNIIIKYAFNIKYNDVTNAFKMYKKEVIDGCKPLISPHFNLTVEIPLKAIIRGFSWEVTPISWKNRTKGVAKLKLREMGSRYFFIIAYLLLEKYFSKGDYHK